MKTSKYSMWVLPAVLVVSFVAAAPSHADDNSPVDPTVKSPINDYIADVGDQFLDNQEKLQDFKGWLISQPGIYDAGYVESVNDADHLGVTLLWSGASPVRDTVAAEASSRGITVGFQDVQYSKPELEAAALSIEASKSANARSGFKVTGIRLTNQQSDGLRVTVSFTGRTRPRMTRIAELLSGRVNVTMKNRSLASRAKKGNVAARKAANFTPRSIRVQQGGQPLNFKSTRNNDTPSFNAGGLMAGNSGGACSSGFAINYEGHNHTTTAWHRIDEPWHAWSNSKADYGRTFKAVHDKGGAKLLTGAGSSLMFDGAANNPDGYTKKVQSLTDVSLNDQVCTSGGNTGVHCNIKVIDTAVRYSDDLGGTVFNAFEGHQIDGKTAGGEGDGGGPVLVPIKGGVYVRAAGMIQGKASDRPTDLCTSVFWYKYTVCSDYVLFTSMHVIINQLKGSSLVTAP